MTIWSTKFTFVPLISISWNRKISHPKKKRRIKPVFIILPILLLAGGYYGFTRLQHSMHYESTDNAFVESNALLVAARIPGYIDSILVDDYQEVQPGQALFRLDDRELKISVLQAEADLASAEAELEKCMLHC